MDRPWRRVSDVKEEMSGYGIITKVDGNQVDWKQHFYKKIHVVA